jgi:ATP-dependent helicase Lhr and Lhr-like helicase
MTSVAHRRRPKDRSSKALSPEMAGFHPVIQTWFRRRFSAPTDAQTAGWPHIRESRDVLIAAPTGSGKTLAAFLVAIDGLIKQTAAPAGTTVLYVSPLKALSNDIQRNLETPLAEIQEIAAELGYEIPRITAAVRTGDTPNAERQSMIRRPPDILITTPESLYLMLTADRGRQTLVNVRTIIVDEIHALARDKRGSHLSLSLARLEHVVSAAGNPRPARVGLSATQRPIEEIAAFLAGSEAAGGCTIVDLGHQRDIDLQIEVPPTDLEAVASAEQWGDLYDRLAQLIREHRTTLIFVNTRRLSERVAHNLSQRFASTDNTGMAFVEENAESEATVVASHHGSLSRERRLRVEERLKNGQLRALVATASLELGIDIGTIDLVCQIGSPRSIATFLQRVGRSGHALGLRPSGRLFPTTRDELIECGALIRAVKAGRLDRITQPKAPLDILAQQIVAEVSCGERDEDALFDLFRRAWPYRTLRREDYDDVVTMLSDGVGEGAGRSPALIHRDRINHMLKPRRNSRLTALLNGGAIPELGDFRVVAEPDETVVGTVGEDWATESMGGDIFLLGSTSWKIRRVESATATVRVEDAHGAPPTIPFWLGEAPGRTVELSEEVGRLRRDVASALGDTERLRSILCDECGLNDLGASQVVDYLRATRDALGLVPDDHDVLFERFFDESGGMQLVVHAPFGARINRAWGLTLRKRFCVRFDFELQAAANDDAIVLSLGPQHSFPLEEAFHYVGSRNVESSLTQAVLYAPTFPTRWRWDASRALAVPRRQASRKVPPNIQRMRADDLLASVFPAQAGCQENVTGPLELPDHPLIRQTVHDCLHEAMDLDGLVTVLSAIEGGRIHLHARDTVEPSPMAHEILNGKPYTYLDDAPLEERRTRAVTMRRSLPESARDLGALDEDAIARVREEAWPVPRDSEELHDALLQLVAVRESDMTEWRAWFEELVAAGRASEIAAEGGHLWIAAESVDLARALYRDATITPEINLPPGAALQADREDARLRMLRGHMEALGPVSVADLARRACLGDADIEYGLRGLEAAGDVLRGRFTPGVLEDEFCDRRLLARIHRYTLDRLRREIDPVSAQDFMRFLFRWHHLTPDTRLEGKAGVKQAIATLEGFEAAASAWEPELLSPRVGEYRASWLDELSLSGEVAWVRLTPRKTIPARARSGPTRQTPVTICSRANLQFLLAAVRTGAQVAPKSGAAAEIHQLLEGRGALFFDEIVARTRRLATDVERGLGELVALGLVTADGFQGLRQLSGGNRQARHRSARAMTASTLFAGAAPAGRWSLVHAPFQSEFEVEALAEAVATVLLRRYGVVFRDVVQREILSLPWREILRALRRLEARGEVRGGRFVSGFVGEQYALPEAVDALRRVRRQEREGERVWISGVDPLNLSGIIVPGPRIPAQRRDGMLFVDGLPAAEEPRPMSTERLLGAGRPAGQPKKSPGSGKRGARYGRAALVRG